VLIENGRIGAVETGDGSLPLAKRQLDAAYRTVEAARRCGGPWASIPHHTARARSN
jgi:hypothetical protein